MRALRATLIFTLLLTACSTADALQVDSCFQHAHADLDANAHQDKEIEKIQKTCEGNISPDWNDVLVVACYREAAERGNRAAQYELGEMYDIGRGTSIDRVQAHDWYQKSADQGLMIAQSYLGDFGRMITVDQLELLQKAAEGGYRSAQIYLADRYRTGEAVLQDYGKAAAWYCRAAAQGSTYGAENLGSLYMQGWGVPKDAIAAYAWMNIGHAQDGDDIQISIDNPLLLGDAMVSLRQNMTPEALTEAQNLSSSLAEKIGAMQVSIPQK